MVTPSVNITRRNINTFQSGTHRITFTIKYSVFISVYLELRKLSAFYFTINLSGKKLSYSFSKVRLTGKRFHTSAAAAQAAETLIGNDSFLADCIFSFYSSAFSLPLSARWKRNGYKTDESKRKLRIEDSIAAEYKTQNRISAQTTERMPPVKLIFVSCVASGSFRHGGEESNIQ